MKLIENMRAIRIWSWLDEFIQDICYGLRLLRKSPGFTAAAVISLAVGIGPNTSIFTIINAAFLGPVGVRDLRSLYVVGSADTTFRRGQWAGTSVENFDDLVRQNNVFSDLAASRMARFSLNRDGRSEAIQGQFVSSRYFDVLGVNPILGRTFFPDEDKDQDRDPFAVISYNLWREDFGSDPDIVGKEIQLNSQKFSIIGVAPSQFKGTVLLGDADRVWIPRSMVQITSSDRSSDRRDTTWAVFARLKPGATRSQAVSGLKTIGTRLEKDYPQIAGRGFRLDSLADYAHGTLPGSMLGLLAGMLTAAVGLVLLLTCINLANLLLARGAYRQREIGIRASLGGSRIRLVRQLLTESILLAAIGGLAGLFIARWTINYMWSLRPPGVRLDAMELTLDGHVFAFNLLVSLAAGLFFGLAPAIQLSKSDISRVLHGGAIAGALQQRRLRALLVVSEIALTLVALFGAGLLLRVVQTAENLDRGFDSRRVGSIAVDLGNIQREPGRELYRNAIGQAAAIPGVEAATVMSSEKALFRSVFTERDEHVPGYHPIGTATQLVSSNFFTTMRIRLLAGRSFTESDREGAVPVAIISRSAAQRLWPGENPLGRRFHFYHDTVMREIIGVVPEVVFVVMPDPPPVVYLPLEQVYGPSGFIFVRASKDPRPLLGKLRNTVNGIDSRVSIGAIETAEERIDRGMTAVHAVTETLSASAAFTMFLAVIGVYGVVAFSVSHRTREFGIRMALGARRSNVLRLVLTDGLRLTFAGVVVGLFLSRLLAPVFSRFLFFGVKITPGVYIVPACLLSVVGLLACYLPARRSTRIGPLVALRHE
jgi:putative ABC transport system permease protein